MKDLFEAAAGYVKAGWCQGISARRGNVACQFDHDFATCFCAAGAIARVAKAWRGSAWRELYSEALAYANKHIRATDPKLHLMSWNDVPERTQDDVVALLHAIAVEVACVR